MSFRENLPHIDFIGIGTPKAATGWIYKCLKEHPNICGSLEKEAHVFHPRKQKVDFDQYGDLFSHCEQGQLCGEFSHMYFSSNEALRQLHRYYPNAKLILSLRNPIERIASLYYYRKSKGKSVASTIRQELANNPTAYLEQGLYSKHLSKWLEKYPREQICILIFEDIQQDPTLCIRNIYQFLGVNAAFTPQSLGKRYNATAKNKLKLPTIQKAVSVSQAVVANASIVRTTIKPALKTLRAHEVADQFRKLNTRQGEELSPIERKEMHKETREWLREYYREDIRSLEKLLNRDLSFWR